MQNKYNKKIANSNIIYFVILTDILQNIIILQLQ
jgi:hypothetical protein